MTTGSAIREPSGSCLRYVVRSFGIRLPQKKNSPKRSTFHYFWNHFLPFHSCASLPSLNDTLAVAWVAARHLLVGFPLALFKLSGTLFKSSGISQGNPLPNTCFRKRFLLPNPTRVPGSLGVTLPRSVTCPSTPLRAPTSLERGSTLKKKRRLTFCTICFDWLGFTSAPGNHSRRNLRGHHRNRVSHRNNPTFPRFLCATRREITSFFSGVSRTLRYTRRWLDLTR